MGVVCEITCASASCVRVCVCGYMHVYVRLFVPVPVSECARFHACMGACG